MKRTRYAHTVTTAALFNNLCELHEYYCNSETGDAIVTSARWRASREEASVQFKYWSTDNTAQRHGDGRLLGDDNYGHTGDAWNPSGGSVQPDHRAGQGVVVTETIVDRSTSTGQRK